MDSLVVVVVVVVMGASEEVAIVRRPGVRGTMTTMWTDRMSIDDVDCIDSAEFVGMNAG